MAVSALQCRLGGSVSRGVRNADSDRARWDARAKRVVPNRMRFLEKSKLGSCASKPQGISRIRCSAVNGNGHRDLSPGIGLSFRDDGIGSKDGSFVGELEELDWMSVGANAVFSWIAHWMRFFRSFFQVAFIRFVRIVESVSKVVQEIDENRRIVQERFKRIMGLFSGGFILFSIIPALFKNTLCAAHAATTEILIKGSSPSIKAVAPTLKEKFMYAIDYFFSVEPMFKALIITVSSCLIIAVGGILYHHIGSKGENDVVEGIWMAWTFLADPGSQSEQDTLEKRFIAVPLTISGMLFFALLVGIMSDGVSSRIDELKNGNSIVIEQNHTLVIGWTPKTIHVIRELALANQIRKQKTNIVVMGNKEKSFMDEALKENLPLFDRYGTKIVARKGNPTIVKDLITCSVTSAKSILILAPPNINPDLADAQVIQACLTLSHVCDIRGNIVAEFNSLKNIRILQNISNSLQPMDENLLSLPQKPSLTSLKSSPELIKKEKNIRRIFPVVVNDLVSRFLIERTLKPDISAVFSELLAFEGNEFRFKSWPELEGKQFGECIFLFSDAILCGIKKFKTGNITINPPLNEIVEANDELLFISVDEKSYKIGKSNAPQSNQIIKSRSITAKNSKEKRILICGMSENLPQVLSMLNSNVRQGSKVTILTESDNEWENIIFNKFDNILIDFQKGDCKQISTLENLPLESYNCVLIFNQKDSNFVENQDLDTPNHIPDLIAMNIRHIQKERGCHNCQIIAELEMRSGDAISNIQHSWLSDSIIPGELQSLILAQITEDSDVGTVLDFIANSKSSVIDLRNAMDYVNEGEELTFWELQERVLQQREIMIAHKNVNNGGEWSLNPKNKSEKLVWNKKDKLIVLSS